ncbi:hypothetical protein MSG_04631 [Mycobacterium shigaense]|uniref:Uncharacterized protein n=2 Tax=Mycobacterium shigaense TaxID=722731 RepID=A0A1Z4EP35_9MYCO|nr:hypothetical protein B2J96_10695 [Mycobacterium shigaense]BAX94745.1 hypothetical protein MSG_04631 [Mycobacterium shigaense]
MIGCILTAMTSVSVICPTYQRGPQLRRMIGHFEAQTFTGELQLMILDDSPEPDESLAAEEYRNAGIHYFHRSGHQMSIGAKLNALMDVACGDVVMRFDDDDYYAPHYVERMLALLGDDDYLTLSGWFLYSEVHAKFCYWETDALSPMHFVVSPHDKFVPVSTAGMDPASVRPHVNGYGFASAWRRNVADIVRFPNQNHGEDEQFVDDIVKAGLRTRYAADVEGLALHLVHHDNISRAFPQYVLPGFMLARYFPGYAPPAADG